MSKITMDNLSDNLKAYMDSLGLSEDQVIELIKNNISGDLEGLNTTDKSSLVAAINELFQSANNGKELIANAIGEPLNSSDTFSAMSNEINGLNSQFKSALMNNGVSVATTDKFKQLIEKLASLANSEGKGIQYAEGTYTNPSDKAISVSVDTNLGFTPSLFIVTIKGIKLQGINNVVPYGPRDMTLTTLCPTIGYTLVYDSGGINTDTKLTLTYDANSFSVSKGSTRYVYFTTNTTFNWYAIGVGEEDTTLEDSLRDILGNKGVEVTEEDDLASLITKVDTIKQGSTFPEWYDYPGTVISSTTTLPTSCYYSSGCSVGDNIYIMGGYTGPYGDNISNNECYNTINDTIVSKTSLPIAMRSMALSSIGTNVYIMGGYKGSDSKNCYLYDTISDSFSTKEQCPFGGSKVDSVVYNKKIHYFTSNGHSCYDPELNTWTSKKSVSVNTFYSLISELIGDKIYLIAKDSGTTYVQEYDILLDTWTTKTQVKINGFNLSGAGVIDDKIYYISQYESYNYVDYYDTAKDEFKNNIYNFNTRANFGAYALNNRCIYLFGGKNYNDSSSMYNNIRVYVR